MTMVKMPETWADMENIAMTAEFLDGRLAGVRIRFNTEVYSRMKYPIGDVREGVELIGGAMAVHFDSIGAGIIHLVVNDLMATQAGVDRAIACILNGMCEID